MVEIEPVNADKGKAIRANMSEPPFRGAMNMIRTSLAMLVALTLLGATGPAAADGCVILLHGLGRTPLSMLPLELAVERAGFKAVNHGYPSLTGC